MGVPIRSLASIAIVALFLTYSSIGFFGGYEYNNNIAMNSTLAQAYNTVVVNPSNPNGMFYLGNLSTQANQTQVAVRNVTFLSILGASLTAVQQAGRFVGTVPMIFYSLIDFVSQPFIAIGIPTGYIKAGLTILLILIMVLSLISALLIYPV